MKQKDILFPEVKSKVVIAEAVEKGKDDYIIRAYFETEDRKLMPTSTASGCESPRGSLVSNWSRSVDPIYQLLYGFRINMAL